MNHVKFLLFSYIFWIKYLIYSTCLWFCTWFTLQGAVAFLLCISLTDHWLIIWSSVEYVIMAVRIEEYTLLYSIVGRHDQLVCSHIFSGSSLPLDFHGDHELCVHTVQSLPFHSCGNLSSVWTSWMALSCMSKTKCIWEFPCSIPGVPPFLWFLTMAILTTIKCLLGWKRKQWLTIYNGLSKQN